MQRNDEEKGLLFRVEELVNEIKQDSELILEYFQKFLNIWAEATKGLIEILESDRLVLYSFPPLCCLKFGENKIYEWSNEEGKYKETDIREVPVEKLKKAIEELPVRIEIDIIRVLEMIKEANYETLSFLKKILFTYGAEQVEKTVTAEIEQSKMNQVCVSEIQKESGCKIQTNEEKEKNLLFNIEELVSEIKQNAELIAKYFQKFLDMWAEATKNLAKTFPSEEIEFVSIGSHPFFYYLRYGENKIYRRYKNSSERGEEINLQEIPVYILETGIFNLDSQIVKEVLCAYKTEQTKKAVTFKTKQLLRNLRT